jgi:hypothetical protein
LLDSLYVAFCRESKAGELSRIYIGYCIQHSALNFYHSGANPVGFKAGFFEAHSFFKAGNKGAAMRVARANAVYHFGSETLNIAAFLPVLFKAVAAALSKGYYYSVSGFFRKKLRRLVQCAFACKTKSLCLV